MRHRIKIALAALVVLAVIGLWQHGTFDRALVNVGLNAKQCARNGLGATFCGQELTEYNEHIERVKGEGEAAKARIEEAGRQARAKESEEQAAITRSTEEAEQRIQREGREAQEAIRRSTEHP